MSKARLVITAVTLENRPVAQVAADYNVARSWIYELLARYKTEGEAAFEPRSRRPHTSPGATDLATVELILVLRKELTQAGLDAGAETIAWHLSHHHKTSVSRATIHRILLRNTAVVPDPSKRPKSSYLRFEAEQPNETWQSDFTHYRLLGGQDVEVITWLDDHSRMALHISAHRRITAPIVADTFTETAGQHGYPASTLTDNGMVYTVRFASHRGGKTRLELELRRLGIVQKNSRPNHPTTCGKVERFQQTMKKWLRAQPDQPATITELQALLDQFRDHYNQHRPHRSLEHRATPATAYAARPKATPGADRSTETHDRVRTDRVSKSGSVTLRHGTGFHHIGVGRTYAGTYVRLLIQDLNITIIDAATGEILRELVLDPTRDYQPTGRPPGPAPKTNNGPTKS
ncbi:MULTISPECIES: IS481 family transposase [unclassified Nocardioides]|uniref:IS481 family transposase n=1 Tax=unclassified Nocardioides TaxID=2615069 RepID=UPI0006F95174|nr:MULTISPECIES: IS481 family transposase [unclassified Nocardioides]KRA37961.1 transposase [Nocardioides sp. Root614]KRA91921.1 transposase [Nocardioides sp. Root682]